MCVCVFVRSFVRLFVRRRVLMNVARTQHSTATAKAGWNICRARPDVYALAVDHTARDASVGRGVTVAPMYHTTVRRSCPTDLVLGLNVCVLVGLFVCL